MQQSKVSGDVAEAFEPRPWPERLIRFGWLAKGVVYTLMGITTIQIARHRPTGQDASPEGSIGSVGDAPFGRVLLVVLAFGLLLYAAWRLVGVAITRGHELASWGDRIGYSFSGIFYILLAWTAASAALSGNDPAASNSVETMSRAVLDVTAGRWLLGIAGIITIAIGIYFAVHKGLRRSFLDDLGDVGDSPHHTEARHTLVVISGVVGWVGRGVVITLVGFFVMRSAIRFDPGEARGFDSSLRQIAETTTGTALVLACAVGLLAHGIFCLASHRLRTLGTR